MLRQATVARNDVWYQTIVDTATTYYQKCTTLPMLYVNCAACQELTRCQNSVTDPTLSQVCQSREKEWKSAFLPCLQTVRNPWMLEEPGRAGVLRIVNMYCSDHKVCIKADIATFCHMAGLFGCAGQSDSPDTNINTTSHLTVPLRSLHLHACTYMTAFT